MKKAIRIVITVILSVCIIVGYYYYLSHKNDNKSSESTKEMTEVEKIISRDFEAKYPVSPREVVKWYNRIITAYYAEEYTDKQLEQMAEQARMLMDDELRKYNSKEQYLADLKKDIADYRDRNKKIVQSRVCDSDEIVYAKVQGSSCAYVNAYYFAKEGSDYSRTYQEFVLRKDKEGKWKILTFRLTKGEQDD